eukprot:1156835-Pelagomonas_calceolata.AAC.8
MSTHVCVTPEPHHALPSVYSHGLVVRTSRITLARGFCMYSKPVRHTQACGHVCMHSAWMPGQGLEAEHLLTI